MPQRDRGGSFSLDNPDDKTPIRQMFSLEDRLLLITDKCTYQMQLADQIDPTRSNPNLPHNVHQKLFDHGMESALFRDTLLLGKIMFKPECQPQLDHARAMQLSFDAFAELVSMNETAKAFGAAEQDAIRRAEAQQEQSGSLAIPSVGNVKTHCKTFMQKADHFSAALLYIVRLFYPDQKRMNWDDVYQLVSERYGADDNYFKVLELTVPMLKLVRNARDCLEHHNRGADIRDFHLQADGLVSQPTIEVDFRKSIQERCPISWFMNEAAKSLRNSFEMILMHTCAKHVHSFAGMPITIGLLNEQYQKAWGVRFAYGMYYADGQFVPMG